MRTIDIYTTPQCGFCKQLKTVLQERGIAYIEHDVTASEQRLREMQEITRNALSVPVVVTDRGTTQQKYAIGFDEATKLLQLASGSSAEVTASAEMANLTCPRCDHVQAAPIPTTACVPFYACGGCGQTIQAKGEDCCVFCSYADRPCPLKSVEKEGGCADGACSIPTSHP